jgi:aldehyde dehydrogenase (NAD+)
VAPDHIYVHRDVKDAFISRVIEHIQAFYYRNGDISEDFPSIINDKHVERLAGLIAKEKVVFGGHINQEKRLIEPTIMDAVTYDDAIMGRSDFRTIMPILSYDNADDLLKVFQTQEKPLAFYLFTQNSKEATTNHGFSELGGGCINDTIMHLTNDKLPFGGIGRSGMEVITAKSHLRPSATKKSILKKQKLNFS